MHEIEILRADHVSIGRMADSLATIVNRPAPGNSLELFRLRGELRRAVLKHLALEDWVVYPRILANARPQVRDLAGRLAGGATAFSAAFQLYSRRWTTNSIAADWQGFRKETLAILAALQQRITFEEDELYPLVAEQDTVAVPTLESVRWQQRR